MSAAGPASPAAEIALTVDAAAERKAINPNIYGLNFAKESFAKEIGLPVRRWGGNTTSRYNWQINAMNHGSDWFFHNNVNFDPYGGGSESADQWVAQNIRTGTASLITVPLIGYVAKNVSQSSYGFSIAKYGPQDQTDTASGFPDCGNGFSGGVAIKGNDPLDTSKAVTETFTADWVKHLKATYGAAAAGGVKFYALDNEPGLWHETHRDVHAAPFSYDESYNQGSAYAAVIKALDPDALILGPAQDGWSRYWYSSYRSQAEAENERQSHGGMYFVPWYLQQMKAYQQAKGLRVLDYLDLHFYPQNGVDLSTAGGTATQALRLRSTRALWDPGYVDESWIGSAGLGDGIVRLIPRMKEWVDTYYPGTKLALTEYNWGGLEHMNGALTQADLLGLFGRKGLDLATLWNYPERFNPAGEEVKYDVFETLPGAYTFRIYLNYDGNGARFGDVSVSATTSDPSQLAVYAAQRSSDSTLTVLVINKTAGALTGNVKLAGIVPGAAAKVYRYSNDNLSAIVRAADQPVAATGFSASFPASSITLLALSSSDLGNQPSLNITMSQSTYTTGDTITASEFRIKSPNSSPVPVELRVWIKVPSVGEIDLINIGAGGTFSLPGSVDANLGPLSLITITSTFPPRGSWEFNSRIKNPTTGVVLSEDINAFTIQ